MECSLVAHILGERNVMNVMFVLYVCVCVQDTFCLTFSVEMDFFGDLRTIGLKQGGEDVPVTEENRHEYVELMVDYLLNR
jgi:hypothetical protein